MLLNRIFLQKAHTQPSGQPEGFEEDRPNVGAISILVFAVIVFLAVVGAAGEQVMNTLVDIESQEKSGADPVLREHLATSEAILTQYDVVDKDKGLYQIPIEQAMQEMVKKQSVDPLLK